jgi:Na+/glutamate symporter
MLAAGKKVSLQGVRNMKTIFWSVSVTLATVALVTSLFLNTILGLFGWAATSIETLQELRSSQHVVEQMKQRHQNKELVASKKLVKRSTKRIGAAMLAAATVGTVAVTTVVIGLEVADYCEEKQSFQEAESILYGTEEVFDMVQCFSDARGELTGLLVDVKDASIDAVLSAFAAKSDDHSDP